MRALRFVSLGLVLLVAAVAQGCAGGGPQTTASSSSPAASATASQSVDQLRRDRAYWRSQARGLSGVLSSLRLLETSWSYEPRGDLPLGQKAVAATLAFAEVVGFKADGSLLALDYAQFFMGDAAVREARRDGLPMPESLIYIRNAHEHVQTMRTRADCVVVPFVEYGGSDGLPQGVVYPVADLLALSNAWYADPWKAWPGRPDWYRAKSGHEVPYWVVLADGRVTALLEIYHP